MALLVAGVLIDSLPGEDLPFSWPAIMDELGRVVPGVAQKLEEVGYVMRFPERPASTCSS